MPALTRILVVDALGVCLEFHREGQSAMKRKGEMPTSPPVTSTKEANKMRGVSKRFPTAREKALIRRHHLHLGLYERIARRLRIDRSYVSRVATGQRDNQEILAALIKELKRIERS